MSDLDTFIANFLTAVDFQEAVELAPDTKFAELTEWDSLAALGVIVMCDMEYGLTITGGDLKDCPTLQDLFALIQSRKK